MRIVVEQVGSSTDSSGSSGGFSTDTFSSSSSGLSEEVSRLEMLNGLGAAITGVIEGFNRVKTSALDFAQKIEQFAPNIQVANAQRDITMMGAMQNADRVAGADIGRLIQAQANSDASMLRMEAIVNKYGARLVTPIEELRTWSLERVEATLVALDKAIENNPIATETLIDIFAPAWGAFDAINKYLNADKKAEELKRKAEQAQNGIGSIFRFMPTNEAPLPGNRAGGPFRVGV